MESRKANYFGGRKYKWVLFLFLFLLLNKFFYVRSFFTVGSASSLLLTSLTLLHPTFIMAHVTSLFIHTIAIQSRVSPQIPQNNVQFLWPDAVSESKVVELKNYS